MDYFVIVLVVCDDVDCWFGEFYLFVCCEEILCKNFKYFCVNWIWFLVVFIIVWKIVIGNWRDIIFFFKVVFILLSMKLFKKFLYLLVIVMVDSLSFNFFIIFVVGFLIVLLFMMGEMVIIGVCEFWSSFWNLGMVSSGLMFKKGFDGYMIILCKLFCVNIFLIFFDSVVLFELVNDIFLILGFVCFWIK